MSDADLRELERRFRASGSPQDEHAWLRARLQAGRLDPRRLRLAVLAGHPPAVELAGGPVAFNSSLELLRALQEVDPEAIYRAQSAFLHDWFAALPTTLPPLLCDVLKAYLEALDDALATGSVDQAALDRTSVSYRAFVDDLHQEFALEAAPFLEVPELLRGFPKPQEVAYLRLRAYAPGHLRTVIGPRLAAWALA